jgi:hypothetical protein
MLGPDALLVEHLRIHVRDDDVAPDLAGVGERQAYGASALDEDAGDPVSRSTRDAGARSAPSIKPPRGWYSPKLSERYERVEAGHEFWRGADVERLERKRLLRAGAEYLPSTAW